MCPQLGHNQRSSVLECAKSVRFSPLARDRLQLDLIGQKNINFPKDVNQVRAPDIFRVETGIERCGKPIFASSRKHAFQLRAKSLLQEKRRDVEMIELLEISILDISGAQFRYRSQ